jgi:hypothetical protein
VLYLSVVLLVGTLLRHGVALGFYHELAFLF